MRAQTLAAILVEKEEPDVGKGDRPPTATAPKPPPVAKKDKNFPYSSKFDSEHPCGQIGVRETTGEPETAEKA